MYKQLQLKHYIAIIVVGEDSTACNFKLNKTQIVCFEKIRGKSGKKSGKNLEKIWKPDEVPEKNYYHIIFERCTINSVKKSEDLKKIRKNPKKSGKIRGKSGKNPEKISLCHI